MIQSETELERIRQECRRMVTSRALASAGVVVIPIPLADLAADVGILTTMLPAISARFELDHDSVRKLDPQLAQRVLVIAAGLGNNMIGRLVTKKLIAGIVRRMGVRIAAASAARYVPLLGSAVAASLSFGAMKLAGDAHIEDCYRTASELLNEQRASAALSPRTPARSVS